MLGIIKSGKSTVVFGLDFPLSLFENAFYLKSNASISA